MNSSLRTQEASCVPGCAMALVAALLLAGCVPVPGDDREREIVAINTAKSCDRGRAVYTNYRGGIAVVENAPECATTPASDSSAGTDERSEGVTP